MERRFSHDFSRVRVHSGRDAEQSAREIGAHAYTVGHNIVFAAGRFTPSTREGRSLLAHELTHVVQQSNGHPALSKKETDKGGEEKVFRKVKIPPGTTSVQEFRRYAEVVIFGHVINLPWKANDNLAKRYQNIANHVGEEVTFGFSRTLVTSQGAETAADQTAERSTVSQEYKALKGDELGQINDEIDERYYASTGLEPGTKIKAGEKGKEAIWNSFKRQVLADRRKIDALPQDIKNVLFSGGGHAPQITPENYSQILRIAQKLTELSPAERQDYLARVNAETSSWDALESAVNSHIEFLAQREKESGENETAAKPLLGAENLYTLYGEYQIALDNLSSVARSRGGGSLVQGRMDKVAETKAALLAALKLKGFDSIDAFKNAMEAYRIAFRTQTVNLALDVLARYDHMLFEERKKLQQPGAVAAIVQGIRGSGAAKHYEEAKQSQRVADAVALGHDPMDKMNRGRDALEAKKYQDEANKARDEAEADVIKGSGNDPLVSERSIDRQTLAGLDAPGAQTYLTKILDERTADVATARTEFKADPDRVFKLPDLIGASQQIQGIDANTIYGKIISDYIKDEAAKHLVSQIAIGILAIALTFLVPGGGWLAAAALVANAGISVFQAYTAYKEYEEQERDYTLHFLSDEPSLVWAGIAIAAAALDLGVAASVVVKESSAALKALKEPMLEFSKLEAATNNDLAKLVSKIEAADGLKAEVKAALEREAQSSLAAKQIMKEMTGKVFSFAPGAEVGVAVQGFRVLYYTIKRGFNTIAKLRADAKFIEAIGDITRMTGVERSELETAFEEVKQIVKASQAKSMDEASVLGYIDRWAVNRSKPGFEAKLFEEMDKWKPLTPDQKRTLSALVEQKGRVADLYKEKDALEKELKELSARQSNPETGTPEGRARLLEIRERLGELDPKTKAETTRIKVTQRNKEGEIEEDVKTVKAKYPPGKIELAEESLTKAEKAAAQAQLSLYDRIRVTAPSDAAAQRARKGFTVDQVGPLLTPPKALHVDHIVSIREIVDMDGFADLLWKDQKAIVDMEQNLILMDASANSSKGERTWQSWPQAKNFYGQPTIGAMTKREADVRFMIQAKIKELLPKLPATRL